MQAATDTHALQKLQRNRLRMTGISVVNFSLQTGVLALYAMAGTVQWWVVAAFLLAGVGNSACFWLAIRRGWNLRLRDPGMLAAQMGASWVVQVAFIVAAPQLAFIFLVSLLVGYNLTMIAFDGRQYTIAWLLQAAATAAALYVAGDRMAYPGTSRAETAILWLFFVLCMHQLTAIGGQFSTLRAKLSQKNQQLRESLERIEQLASHDDLTGVLNRRSFMAQLAAEAARAQRSGMPFCVAVFDIDHFKAVNDKFGHPVGDQVLKEFCRVAGASLRVSDVFARFGGEEFILLMTLPTDCSVAERAVQRIRQAVAAHDWSALTPGAGVTVSAGVACFRRDETAEQLVSRADAALYRAKSAGRNRVELQRD